MSFGLLSLGRPLVTKWQTLKIGAGGQLRGLDIALDGTIVVKADVGNGYVLPAGTSTWRPLVTTTSMPANSGFAGLWAVAIAYSNSNRIYFNMLGNTFVSSNQGLTNTLTGFPRLTGYDSDGGTDANGHNAFSNQKLVVDPVNPDVVYLATNNNGIQRSINAGVSASTVSDITAASSSTWGGAGICFDLSSGTVSVSGQTRTKTIYVGSAGHGVWQSTDGGVSFAQIANGTASPLNIFNAAISPDGVYYCSATNGAIWRWQSSTWTTIFTAVGSFYCGLATFPDNNGRLIITVPSESGGKGGHETLDYGASFVGSDTWSATYPPSPSRDNVATDIPWLANSDNGYMTIGNIKADPSIPVKRVTGNTSTASKTITNISSMTGLEVGQYVVANGNFGINSRIASLNVGASTITIDDFPTATATGTALVINKPNLIFAHGIGVSKTNWPETFSGFHYESISAGIEELVARDVIAPYQCPPIVAVEDRSFFVVSDLTAYASRYYPTDATFTAGWSLDYASNDPRFVCGISNWPGSTKSGYSTDGGTTWSLFAANPANQNTGGYMAAASSQKIVWVPADNGRPNYTLDGGATWTLCEDLPNNNGYVNSHYDSAFLVAADRVNIGTFYINNFATPGVYKSTNGGKNWTLVYSGSVIGTNYICRMRCTPGGNAAGDIWFGGNGGNLYHSIDGGTTWPNSNTDVTAVIDFGFGKPGPSTSYPVTIFLAGTYQGTAGVWRSEDGGATYVNIGPTGNLDYMVCINGDMNSYGTCYVGFSGTGYVRGYLN